jgi:hypothetical protein
VHHAPCKPHARHCAARAACDHGPVSVGIPRACSSSPVVGAPLAAHAQRWLLPGNSSKYAKDLLMALRVTKSSTILGKTVGNSGLKKMHGAKLVGYQRNGVWNKRVPAGAQGLV